LLGVYSKAEDTALSAAFGGRKKKRLNRVFDAIGFVYPDYRYPAQDQKRKNTSSAKKTTSAAPSEPAPKRKRVKVLTHRPRYIEPATVPEFAGETSSATEAKEPIPLPKIKELAEVPATEKIEEPRTEETKASEVLSPSAKIEVVKSQKGPAVTLKRKRMVNVLDVLETIKSSSTTPKQTVKTSEVHTEAFTAEASKQQSETEAGPSEPTKVKPLEAEKIKMVEPTFVEETDTAAPEASSLALDYIVRHASRKRLSEEEIFEANHYARELKYPKGALIFNGTDEDDFLYCLPDNKELSVCREMARSMGFPKLEAGLCAMTKDDLADSLAYNSLKERKLYIWKFIIFELFFYSYTNALRAQKNAEDESYNIAFNNLRTEVIKLRNEALEKDKILLTLVDKIKEDEATSKAQAEAQKLEIEDLRKQLARAKEKRILEETKRELSDQWANHL
jgi:hypothetical protein